MRFLALIWPLYVWEFRDIKARNRRDFAAGIGKNQMLAEGDVSMNARGGAGVVQEKKGAERCTASGC
jgi:hypothetical protein